MSDIAISVENLSKSYMVGHNSAKAERYTALRDVIANNARSLARKTRDMFQGKAIVQGDEVEEFWALKDVSFDIKQGDRIGIIGRNGAGKSTLLKILSRITEPTSGRVKINGRVASLLEVGTGFHPELTGRENIYLNGAILGMSRQEIQRKFDEIVAFAEVERFLDTPVKRYSSGMYVRLAFAVAAHLEPEILVVDEVLAVGDSEFQKKCLGKMEEVAEYGRTVLFVSHNMSAISKLCNTGILLQNGRVNFQGTIQGVINHYTISNGIANNRVDLIPSSDEVKNGIVSVSTDAEINILFRIEITRKFRCAIELKFFDMEGSVIAVSEFGASNAVEMVEMSPGIKTLEICIPMDHFLRGNYQVTAALTLPFQKGYAFTKIPATFEVDRKMNDNRLRLDCNRSWGSIRLPATIKHITKIA